MVVYCRCFAYVQGIRFGLPIAWCSDMRFSNEILVCAQATSGPVKLSCNQRESVLNCTLLRFCRHLVAYRNAIVGSSKSREGKCNFYLKTEKVVDSAFLEWDKACMFIHLQQLATRTKSASLKADLDGRVDLLDANTALLLGLAIIPTLSGVALIA